MQSTAPAPLRTARALAVAGLSGVAGTGAHLLAGGETPAPAGAAALAVLLVAAARTLTGRRLDLSTLAAVVLLGQGLAHVVLHLGSAAGTARTPFWGDGALSMTLGHLVVAGLALVVAHRVEQTLWRLATERLHRLPRLLSPDAPAEVVRVPLLPTATHPRTTGPRRTRAARAPPGRARAAVHA